MCVHYCTLCLDVVSDVTQRMLSAEYIPPAWLLANVWEAPHSDPVHTMDYSVYPRHPAGDGWMLPAVKRSMILPAQDDHHHHQRLEVSTQ